jgi:hypothetical protein
MFSQELLAQCKGFKITIENVHIRYEDDFFVSSPYSIGLTMDKITLSTANDEILSYKTMQPDKEPTLN